MNADKAQHDGNPTSTAAHLLQDAFDRVHELVPATIKDLSIVELVWRPDAGANPIGWLVWHLTRVQDDHLASLDGSEQAWLESGWAEKFALPYDDSAIGFGQSAQEVGAFTLTDPDMLLRYHDEVQARTTEILDGLSDDDYDRVIDDSYDPPVTLGARLVSVVNDMTQHIGQAAYVRGLVERRRA